LARAPTSPSRKGKERALTPESSPRNIRNKGKTPRKWSVEIAPDDSVLFAEGIPEEDGVELDIDESVEPPWGDETDDDVGESGQSPELELPALPEIPASFEDSSDEEIVPVVRPESRMRSRFSHSLSTERSRTPLQPRQSPSQSKNDHSNSNSRSKSINDQSMSFTTARTTSLKRSTRPIPPPQDDQDSHSRLINDQSMSFTTAKTTSLSRSTRPVLPTQNDHDSHSRSINDQSTSFKTAKTNSLNRSTRPVPPPQPIFPQEIQVGMALTPPPVATPPRANLSVPGQTPKPPGAWQSTSKPGPKTKSNPSPTPLRNGDTSIHRIRIPNSNRRSPNTSMSIEEGDVSLTQRLISMTKNLASSTRIPKPSTTLSEARESLAKAAEASAIAQRRVEVSQRQWLEALSVGEVVRQGWTWGKWGWWVSMEILLLWGVFR